MFEEKLVAFVDILGFAQEVQSAKTPAEFDALKVKVATLRSCFGEKPSELSEYSTVETISFSDSIVRSRKIANAPLFQEILSLVHAIADILWNGYLVRGALTHGPFFYEKEHNTLISPAFINAYSLESKVASSPRIIVDPETLREFRKRPDWRKQGHSLKDESDYIYGMIRLDTDGYYFIDYLKVILNELDYPPTEYPQYFAKHKNVVVNGLINSKSDSVRSKFIWLAHYHNKVLLELGPGEAGSEWDGWKSGLEIDSKHLHL